jgi:hypothetical protein
MQLDVFRRAELVMCNVRENTGVRKLVNRRACQLGRWNEFFNGARGDDNGTNLGAVIRENGNVALVCGSRNTKDTEADRDVFIAIGRDESDSTRLGKETVVVKM